MSSNVLTIPEGVTKTETVHGLWTCSGYGKGTTFDPKRVEEILERNPILSFVNEKCILADFSTFPNVDVRIYRQHCNVSLSAHQIFEQCIRPRKKPEEVTRRSAC